MMGRGENGSNEVMDLGSSLWLISLVLLHVSSFGIMMHKMAFLSTCLAFQLVWLRQLGTGEPSLSLALYVTSSCCYLEVLYLIEVSGQLEFFHINWLPGSIPKLQRFPKSSLRGHTMSLQLGPHRCVQVSCGRGLDIVQV